jgi:hypothetical protein
MCYPKAQNPDIAWSRDVNEIRLKRPHLRRYPILVAAEERVAGQIVVHRECSWTSLDLDRRDRWLTGNLCSRSAIHTQKRDLPAVGEGAELLTERCYSVGLAEAIGEERDAKWRYQQVVQGSELNGQSFDVTRES